MYKEWAQELRQHLELVGYPEEANRLLQTFAVSGYLGAMRFYVRRMEHAVVTERVYFPGILAQLYAKLGDKDRAFYWLREGIEHHTKAISDPILEWTKVDPGLASLRADSRFSELIRRMGLPP